MTDWLQYGGLGFAAMVVCGVGWGLWRIVNRMIDVVFAPMVNGLIDLNKTVSSVAINLAALTTQQAELAKDVYNGRCRYMTPSAGSGIPAVREPARRDR